MPAQVAVGDDAHELSRLVEDPDAANPLELISTIASAIRAVAEMRGTRSPVCITSRT